MGQSVLNRWENSGNLNRIGSFDNVSVGGKWKAERRAAYPWASSPGQKLASIYRSRVSRRIIISCNWSRENSVLVSRTDALVFAPTLWLCEGGEVIPLLHLAMKRGNFAIIARSRNLISIKISAKNIPSSFSIRSKYVYLSENTCDDFFLSSICLLKRNFIVSKILKILNFSFNSTII